MIVKEDDAAEAKKAEEEEVRLANKE